jgi:L-fuculose-phosphate aldolase
MSDKLLRQAVIETARAMNSRGLNRGSSGNVSVRVDGGMLVTPSGRAYHRLDTEDIVMVKYDGSPVGKRRPSSEWRFHRDIYLARPDVHAVVHTHSTFATTLACLHREVPAFHYMIAATGGKRIRCAAYATFGTEQLSQNALDALGDTRACLLANHGMIVVGTDLDGTLDLAVEVEALCEQYWRASQFTEPHILDDAEMDRVLDRFKDYGANAKQE